VGNAVLSWNTGRVHYLKVVARLAWTSGRVGSVEGQLKQRVYCAGVLFANEPSRCVERLRVEGVNKDVRLRGLRRVMVFSIGPYSCLLFRICSAYADCGLLAFMYRVCSVKRSFRLRLVWPTYAFLHVIHESA
jgi:hypothetical protein